LAGDVSLQGGGEVAETVPPLTKPRRYDRQDHLRESTPHGDLRANAQLSRDHRRTQSAPAGVVRRLDPFDSQKRPNALAMVVKLSAHADQLRVAAEHAAQQQAVDHFFLRPICRQLGRIRGQAFLPGSGLSGAGLGWGGWVPEAATSCVGFLEQREPGFDFRHAQIEFGDPRQQHTDDGDGCRRIVFSVIRNSCDMPYLSLKSPFGEKINSQKTSVPGMNGDQQR
jgi:hypothetical protein